MKEEVYRVVRGYSKLFYTDRVQIRKLIEELEAIEYGEKRETFLKGLAQDVGPLDEKVCPCCGKS